MIETSHTVALVVMWIIVPISVATIVLGYSLWTWGAVFDIVASIRAKRRVEHETFTWLVFRGVVLGITALLLFGQVRLG